jgi:hypothetical protein
VPASREAKILKNESGLANLLKSRAEASLPGKKESFPPLNKEREKIKTKPEAYFYKADITIPLLFSL